MPLRIRSGLVACLVCALVAALVCTTLVCPAEADPKPAGDIAQARKAVRDRSHRLGEAQAQLAQAQARLEDLQADAELLIEDYNGELVRLRRVELAYQQAAGRLRQAERQVDAAREPVAAMVAGSYGELELSQPLVAMIVDSGGPDGYLHRASMLNHLGVEQTATLQRLRDYEQVYSILRGQSQRAYAAQRETTERVQTAKSAAENAVAAQVEQMAQIKRQKEEISRRLDSARSRVERLLRAREEARRRAAVSAEGLTAPSWAVEWAKQASSGAGGLAVQWALTQLGKPYVWAAAGPSSYDCSGLTMRAWEQAGVTLDHWTGTQWTSGPHVPVDNVLPGDLVFFANGSRTPSTIHHVGIYIGRGLMVHAPQTGDVVRIASMWRPDLVGATRPRRA